MEPGKEREKDPNDMFSTATAIVSCKAWCCLLGNADLFRAFAGASGQNRKFRSSNSACSKCIAFNPKSYIVLSVAAQACCKQSSTYSCKQSNVAVHSALTLWQHITARVFLAQPLHKIKLIDRARGTAVHA